MMSSEFSPLHFAGLQAFHASGKTKSFAFRKKQLQILKDALKEHEVELMEALYKDLHKSREESYATEIGVVHAEITHAIKNLAKWMTPEKVSTPLGLFPSSSKIYREHFGVCLIIAPWNYPVNLMLAPLVGSISGGNCTVIKPSELAPHSAVAISRMIAKHFDANFITVVEGDGAKVVPRIMQENRFDHVFFTGSIQVGKEIAKMAAEKLIPVVLELGGKSPCIVDKDSDIKVAAKRIVWGKFTNAGQTCVAPDYLLVHRSKNDELIKEMKRAIIAMYGENPKQSADYARIINAKRFDALLAFIRDGNIVYGGNSDRDKLYIAPTIVDQVSLDTPIMQEEIFGPILPVIPFDTHEEAMDIIRKNPDPLSLYVFTNNNKVEELYINQLEYGGGCINNTLVHLGNAELPFGGVANSGLGSYHGKYSFEAFTRPKSILKTGSWIDPSIKYPPYKGKMKFLKFFFK